MRVPGFFACKNEVKTSMKNTNKREDAVSPVIGVMLMIVVTIIIAAVVSAFAGDLSSGSEKKTTPVASIQCQIMKPDDTDAVLTMKHLSGDAIDTKYVRIIVSYTDSAGTPHQKRTSGYTASGLIDSEGATTTAFVPYLTDAKIGDAGDTATNFGNFVWVPGEIISTGSANGFTGITGIAPVNLRVGTTINVKLVDTHTQKAIIDQDVIVQ